MTNMPFRRENTDYSRFHYLNCNFHGEFKELGKCNDSFAALKFFYSIFIPFMKYFQWTMVFPWSTQYNKKLTGCCIFNLHVPTAVSKMTLVSHSVPKILLYWINQRVFLGTSRLQELQTLRDYLATLVWVLLYFSKPLFLEMSEGCWSPLLSCFFIFFSERAIMTVMSDFFRGAVAENLE